MNLYEQIAENTKDSKVTEKCRKNHTQLRARNDCGKLPTPKEPRCWGGKCRYAVFQAEEGLDYTPTVCSEAIHAEIIGLRACPLGRWRVIEPGPNGCVGATIRWIGR